MAEWDLTTRLGKYLDRHLVFPLLEFLSVKGVSNSFFTQIVSELKHLNCLNQPLVESHVSFTRFSFDFI